MTGQFLGVMGIDASGWVRGRVTSVQAVTISWRRVDTKWRWEPIDGRRECRAVERSPRFFDDERMFTDVPPPVSRGDIGVLITMDLDEVPELPLRPPLGAGDLSTGGNSTSAPTTNRTVSSIASRRPRSDTLISRSLRTAVMRQPGDGFRVERK